jgi:Beta-galactosidase, domain 2
VFSLLLGPLVTTLSNGVDIYRHNPYHGTKAVDYQLKLSPYLPFQSLVPIGGGNLTLHARDSKMLVLNYDVGGIKLAYSTAEVFTWYVV